MGIKSNTELPLVSIGVAVYNGEKYLKRALDSLLSQDYGNFEIIVSDNCSSDETPRILADYVAQCEKIRWTRNYENIGIVSNFNKVLERAEGHYFMWAAVDDYWSPSFISALVNELERYPQAGVAMCAFERLRPDGSRFDIIHFRGHQDPNRKKHLRMALALISPLKYNVFIYGLFRTHLLKRSFRLLPTVPSGDRWFLAQFALAHGFRYVDRILHVRTAHDLPFEVRYPEDGLARKKAALAKKTFKLRGIFDLSRIVLRSPVVPIRRKLCLPILLVPLACRKSMPSLMRISVKAMKFILPDGLIEILKRTRQS